ncbi:MAG: sensor histidine kinase, partial [Thermoanaerobaculia bacterium]
VPALFLSLLLQRHTFNSVNTEFTALLGILFLCVAIFFPMALLGTQDWLHRSLFRESHEVRIALGAFARSVVRILDRKKLALELAESLHSILDLESAGVYSRSEQGSSMVLSHQVGSRPIDTTFGNEQQFGRWLLKQRLPSFSDDTEVPQNVQQTYQRNHWELCIPLSSGNQLLGFISLGRRRGFRTFASGEIEQLNVVADQASIAFENARLYEELRKSRAIIDRASRLSSIGILAAGIAHEIRNPLVSIHTFFQMAPDHFGDEEFMTSFLGLAGEEVQRISTLIDDLLTFARSPSATVTEVDLGDIVDRTLALLAPQARKQRLEIRRSAPEGLPLVLADSDQVLQVIINLVLNAIQATPEGGNVQIN